jgi:hypothetical protein
MLKIKIKIKVVAAWRRGVLLYTNGSSCFDKKTPWRSVGIGHCSTGVLIVLRHLHVLRYATPFFIF